MLHKQAQIAISTESYVFDRMPGVIHSSLSGWWSIVAEHDVE